MAWVAHLGLQDLGEGADCQQGAIQAAGTLHGHVLTAGCTHGCLVLGEYQHHLR